MDKPPKGPGATPPRKFFFGSIWCRKHNLVIRVLVLSCFLSERNYCSCTLYSSLIIVKSLQLRRRKQITKPRKYCLVRVIVFLWRVFSLFVLFLTGWDLG